MDALLLRLKQNLTVAADWEAAAASDVAALLAVLPAGRTAALTYSNTATAAQGMYNLEWAELNWAAPGASMNGITTLGVLLGCAMHEYTANMVVAYTA